MGISMVRRVGPRFSLRAIGPDRFGICQRATDPDVARMVYASERPIARIRVGFWRRKPSGSCLGGLACLQDREETTRRRRYRFSETHFPKAASEFHVVDQSQRRG